MRKTCTKCGFKGTVARFYRDGKSKDGYTHWCKTCFKEQNQKDKARDPEKHRAYMRQRMFLHNLKKLYSMTLEQYQDLLAAQANRCAICNRLFKKTPLIDHCHKTGKVRGLLCRACNTGIGSFKDDPTLTEAATRYLQDSGDN